MAQLYHKLPENANFAVFAIRHYDEAAFRKNLDFLPL
jgi:hypothetical protein